MRNLNVTVGSSIKVCHFRIDLSHEGTEFRKVDGVKLDVGCFGIWKPLQNRSTNKELIDKTYFGYQDNARNNLVVSAEKFLMTI